MRPMLALLALPAAAQWTSMGVEQTGGTLTKTSGGTGYNNPAISTTSGVQELAATLVDSHPGHIRFCLTTASAETNTICPTGAMWGGLIGLGATGGAIYLAREYILYQVKVLI